MVSLPRSKRNTVRDERVHAKDFSYPVGAATLESTTRGYLRKSKTKTHLTFCCKTVERLTKTVIGIAVHRTLLHGMNIAWMARCDEPLVA